MSEIYFQLDYNLHEIRAFLYLIVIYALWHVFSFTPQPPPLYVQKAGLIFTPPFEGPVQMYDEDQPLFEA